MSRLAAWPCHMLKVRRTRKPGGNHNERVNEVYVPLLRKEPQGVPRTERNPHGTEYVQSVILAVDSGIPLDVVMKTGICQWCGREFTFQSKGGRAKCYCSDRCRRQGALRNNRISDKRRRDASATLQR